MKRKIILFGLLIFSAAILTGCCLSHEWQEATCTAPKTCAKCEKTEGEALGHTWEPASCEVPETCSACGETQGEALGHTWQEADCENPETCSVCAKTQGEALGHTWQEANCEAPETCSVCNAQQGEPKHTIYGGDATMAEDGTQVTYTGSCYFCKEEVSISYPDWEAFAMEFITTGIWRVFEIEFADGTSYVSSVVTEADQFVFEKDETVKFAGTSEMEALWENKNITYQFQKVSEINETDYIFYQIMDGDEVVYTVYIGTRTMLFLTLYRPDQCVTCFSQPES